MIVGLCNSRWKNFRINSWEWFRLLSLASAYGWKPLGALQPKGYCSICAWDKENYFTKDEIVIDEDALRIAASIELAIIDIKNSVQQEEDEKIRIEQKIKNSFNDDIQRPAEPIKMDSVQQRENEKIRIERRLKNIFGDDPQRLAKTIKVEEYRALQLGFKMDEVWWLKEFAKFCLQGKFKIF